MRNFFSVMQSRWEGKQPCLTSQPGNYEFLTKLVSNYLNNTLQLELFLTTLWPLIGIECKEYGAPEQPEYEEPSSDYGAPSAEPIKACLLAKIKIEPLLGYLFLGKSGTLSKVSSLK